MSQKHHEKGQQAVHDQSMMMEKSWVMKDWTDKDMKSRKKHVTQLLEPLLVALSDYGSVHTLVITGKCQLSVSWKSYVLIC